MDRLTWLGLAIAAIGWLILLADMLVTEQMMQAGSAVAVATVRADVVTVAQTIIFSGFALAVIGTLRGGFRHMQGVFDLVMDRSDIDAREYRPVPPPSAPIEPYIMTQSAQMAERMTTVVPVRDRNYVILADGSVEVETLLGTRIFASLDEARDFIR